MKLRSFLAVLALSTASCMSGPPEIVRFDGETMGTTYVVQVVGPLSQSDRIAFSRAIQDALDRVDHLMSNYREDSEISRFNLVSTDESVTLSEQTFDVIREARRVHQLTGGAFDVTVAPLVRLWGFGAGASERHVPSDPDIAAARKRVGFEHVRIGDDPPSLRKDIEGVECDLSAIAKGYAVDRIAEELTRRGSENFMVEVGGEVRTAGKNAMGEAWRIGIEKPIPGQRSIQRMLPLSGLSLATSGDYRNFYEENGKIYSHLIDPRLGRPVSHNLASVSVVDLTCMRADALASGLLVLGPEEGFELAVKEDLAVLFLVRNEDGTIEERPTPSFEALFF